MPAKFKAGRGVAVQHCRWTALAIVAALAGCSGPASYNPVDWWHDLEGGRIAQVRPPPPNADAPYRNLSSVPARPPPADPAIRARIAEGLVADRRNAQYALGHAPPPPAAPQRPAAPPASPGGEDAMSASLPASSAPPPPRRAPVGPVQATPLSEPAPAGGAEAAMPAMPDAPPPAPHLPGLQVPDRPAPTPLEQAPPPPPAPVAVQAPGAPVAIAFAPGSAVLPAGAAAALKALAQTRGNGAIAVVGYGGAAEGDPAGQAAALPLAYARAQAIASALYQAGVPAQSVLTTGEAAGNGGGARIVAPAG
jgi:outer membrane protein OmpA-like peptidoglycan-associated protein